MVSSHGELPWRAAMVNSHDEILWLAPMVSSHDADRRAEKEKFVIANPFANPREQTMQQITIIASKIRFYSPAPTDKRGEKEIFVIPKPTNPLAKPKGQIDEWTM